MSVSWNVIVSGVDVSADLDTAHSPLIVSLGNSDSIGSVKFALQNKDGKYTNITASGNAMVQVDLVQNGVVTTQFRGTIEDAENVVDVRTGSVTEIVGYDYAQELLGLISPDARQRSLIDPTTNSMSVTSGEQGMGSRDGMDLVLFVSGVVGSGTVGGGGVLSGSPAATVSDFMSQYFGKSGDTTGSNSGQSFSFKPYLSGFVTWGTNPTYRTWYVQDGASDTNANYWIPYDTLTAKHEYAWDVIRKLTRQGYALDRSGFKTQFEVYVDVSGGIHMRTSGASDFLSNATLVYYQAGTSGSANNNVIDLTIPTNTVQLKDEVVGWFPVWTQYPFTDDYTDMIAYSGGYWSGTSVAGTVTISGTAPAPGANGFMSVMGTNINANAGGTGGLTLIFTLWSGYTLDIQKWNVSGGNGVSLNYLARPSSNQVFINFAWSHNVIIYDSGNNFIIKSGIGGGGYLDYPIQVVSQSGWTSISDIIYTASGTFLSGNGSNGWAASATFPDLSAVKLIGIGLGFGTVQPGPGPPTTLALTVDNLNFQFAYDYSPVITFQSGSIASYGRRYEVFEFPYQYTDSGAAAVVTAELQSKMQSRQLGSFTVKDNPNTASAQFSITPGQVFTVDAPSLGTGSGQVYLYWRATEVRHEYSVSKGTETFIKAYPWFSGATVLSGVNFISYSLPVHAPNTPIESMMPNRGWFRGGGPRG